METVERNRSLNSDKHPEASGKVINTQPESPVSHFVDVLEWNPAPATQNSYDRKGARKAAAARGLRDRARHSMDFKNSSLSKSLLKDTSPLKMSPSPSKLDSKKSSGKAPIPSALNNTTSDNSVPAPQTLVPVPQMQAQDK